MQIERALVAWFREHGRDLPWRRQRSGYAALVSEAMLQQTRVSRVLERYLAFMQRFPTVRALARADEQDVLAHWQGLGYYRRARNLHAAAKRIVNEHGGEVPQSVPELMSLPGVGRYTAGAIASIAFSKREPIVDGNVERVLVRLFAYHAERVNGEARQWAWSQAEQIVASADDPGAVNEAMMELGALICTPRRPACEQCPVASLCAAYRQNLQHALPAPKQAAKQQHVHHHAIIVQRGRRILLEQRPDSGLWSRMWQTPTIEAARQLRPSEIKRLLRVNVASLARCERFAHQTTHRRITFHVFAARSRTRANVGAWREPHDVDDLPLSSPQRRIVDLARALTGG